MGPRTPNHQLKLSNFLQTFLFAKIFFQADVNILEKNRWCEGQIGYMLHKRLEIESPATVRDGNCGVVFTIPEKSSFPVEKKKIK